MKCPDTIKIGTLNCTVEALTRRESERLYGEFSVSRETIGIQFGMGPGFILDTLIHEISHAVYYLGALEESDSEERVCRVMATGWAKVYLDNPDLIKYIGYLARSASNA